MASTETLTFEKVWAALMENREQMKESDLRMKETNEQLKRQMEETDRKISRLGNRFGELAEHLVSPGIMEKFNKLGFSLTQQSMDVEIVEPGNPNTYTEIDILLENNDIVIAVEVKSKPSINDVTDHIKRLEVLRERADKRNDTRKFQGAIAGAIMSHSVRERIIKEGFYPIEQSGDTVKISIPEGFKPRVW